MAMSTDCGRSEWLYQLGKTIEPDSANVSELERQVGDLANEGERSETDTDVPQMRHDADVRVGCHVQTMGDTGTVIQWI
jgi:hypothetical protein